MADTVYVKGATGLISVKKDIAYKPIVCLTSNSLSQSLEVLERITMCTQGKKELKAGDNTASFTGDGFVTVDAVNNSYDAMMELYKEKNPLDFKLEGRGEDKFFKGLITSLDDNYPAEDDATFSFTISIQGDIEDTEPA